MRKNRDKLEIVAAVLKVAGNGSHKTAIMYGANLSYKLLETYLKNALDAGLVRAQGTEYCLTDKGREFLVQYHRFQNKNLRFQERLESLSRERACLERICQKSRRNLEFDLVNAD